MTSIVFFNPKSGSGKPQSISSAMRASRGGAGEVALSHVEEVADHLGLLVGDLGLSTFEDELAEAWLRYRGGEEAAFHMLSAFHRMLALVAQTRHAELLLIDTGSKSRRDNARRAPRGKVCGDASIIRPALFARLARARLHVAPLARRMSDAFAKKSGRESVDV